MKPQITIADFAKLDFRVGEVQQVAEVPGSEKLLELKVSFGEEIGTRVIYAGVREWYKAEKLTGRKLVFVVNLAPKTFKIGGKQYVSEGMLIAAVPSGKAVLYILDEDLPAGTILR